MHTFLSPVPYLEDLAHVFSEACRAGDGIAFDPDLCRAFAEGLTDVAEKVDALVAYVRAHGLVSGAAEERPRTPVERQLVARMLLQAEPGARVVYLPGIAPRGVAVTEGGSAA